MNMPDWISNHSFSKLYFLKLDKTCLVTELYPLLSFFRKFFFPPLKGYYSCFAQFSYSQVFSNHFTASPFPLINPYIWIMCVLCCVGLSHSVGSGLVTPWAVAHQASLSMGILQGRIVGWAAMPSSRGSSQTRDRTQVSHTAGRFFTIWATKEVLMMYGKGQFHKQKVLP